MKKNMIKYILSGMLLTGVGVAKANPAVMGCMSLENSVWVTSVTFPNTSGQDPIHIDVSIDINKVEQSAGHYLVFGSINNQPMYRASCDESIKNGFLSAVFSAGTTDKYAIVINGNLYPEALTSPRGGVIWQSHTHFYSTNNAVTFLPR